MPPNQYPFIDIAVHDQVRTRFAAGDALVLFSDDMKQVLWANGTGCKLFNHDFIYDFLVEGLPTSDVTARQMKTTADQLRETGDKRSFVMRVTTDFQRITIQAQLELITDRAGHRVILFSAATNDHALPVSERAEKMLSGFDDPDTHMAVLGANGSILAASADFSKLGMTAETLEALVRIVTTDADQLVKRPVPTGRGYLPAAIGKLSDDPDMNLLFCVETSIGVMDQTDDAPFGEALSPKVRDDVLAEKELTGTETDDVRDMDLPDRTRTESAFADALDAISLIPANNDLPDDTGDLVLPDGHALPLEDEPQSVTGSASTIVDNPEWSEDKETTETAEDNHTAETEVVTGEPSLSDSAGSRDFVFQKQNRPVRFVWKVDADGRFSDISDEFAQAVGPHIESINSLFFADVARAFKLDPDGRIGDLLAKRDTWSGKTIYWPVEGTDLKVPVDLAALPTYSRSRSFDGFRGFGIVRMNDAIVDPDKIGLQIQSSTVADMLIRSPFGKRGPLEDKTFSDPSPDFDVEDYRRFFEADADQPSDEITGDAGDGLLDAPISGFLDNLPDADSDAPAGVDNPPFLPGFGGETDAFRGEKPALRIVENPGRRHSDKVVSIQAHRSKARDGLSSSEQAAFTEIARQLDPFGKRLSPETQAPKGGSGEQSPQDNAEIERGAKDDAQAANGQALTPEILDGMAALIPSRSNSSEFLTAEFVDALPLAILVHTGETLIHANPEFFRLTGYQSLAQLKDYGGLDALLEQDQTRIIADDVPSMLMVRADGALEPVSARLQSIRWEDSNALLLALVPMQAENDRVQAAKDALPPPDPKSDDTIKALEIEVEELHSILETATDGVVIVGQDGYIRSLNKSASALFNFDQDDVVGKSFAMLFAHESQKAVMDYLAGLTGHGVASVLNDGREVIGRESSGGFIPVFMTMGRLSSSNGYCAVIRDITQWKRTEEELRTAKRAAETANAHKSEFLARVSHEIRTPLNAIIGFSDMMATQRLGPIGHPRYVEYSDDIGRSGRHVLDIVNDLLDISKIEAGEMDLEFTAVELNETVSEAVSLVQPQVNSQRVIVRTSLSQSVPNIVADQRSIKQIAINILANAIRYTPAGGQIVVSTAYEPNGSVVLRIRDTGIGMDRAELEQALKPFRQVTTGNRKKGDGTGLGLPLTKAMVDANRAQFAISSVPDQGTLVEITFPSPRVLAN